jgi:ATP-dependent DNA ligase
MLSRFAYPMRPKEESLASRLVVDTTAWYIQPKYNGWHVLALPDGRLYTRHGQDISAWPGVQAIRKALRLTVPVVGELLHGANNDGILSLQQGGVGKLVVFDLVTRGGFGDRSFALGSLPTTRGVVEVAETFLPCRSWAGIRKLLEAQQGKGHEGLVLKHRGGLYELGKGKSVESRQQVKLKNMAALGAA